MCEIASLCDLKSKPGRLFLSLTTFCGLLLLSCFVTPSALMNRYESGPIIWLSLIIAVSCIWGGLILWNSAPGKFIVSLSNLDYVIILILIYPVLINLFRRENIFQEKVICITCLTFFYFFVKVIVNLLPEVQIRAFSYFFTAFLCILLFISLLYGLTQEINLTASGSIFFRITGQFDNPARYAIFIATLMPFCILAISRLPTKGWFYICLKAAAVFTSAMGFLMVIYLGNRSAIIAVILMTSIFLSHIYKGSKSRSKYLIGLIGGGALAAFLFFSIHTDSVKGRFTIWSVASKMVSDHPFFGIGYGNFENRYDLYQSEYFRKASTISEEAKLADTVRYAYNDLYQILCEQGIIGILIYFALFYSVYQSVPFRLHNIKGSAHLLVFGSTLSLFVILLCSLVSYPFEILTVKLFFYTFLAILSGLNKNHKHWDILNHGFNWNKLIAFKLLITGLGLIYFSESRWQAYRNWKTIVCKNYNSVQLIKYLPQLDRSSTFLLQLSKQMLQEKKQSDVIRLLVDRIGYMNLPDSYVVLGQAYALDGQIQNAEKSFLTARYMVPNRFYSRFVLAGFYFQYGQVSKGEILADQLLQEKPKFPSLEIDEMKEILRLYIAQRK